MNAQFKPHHSLKRITPEELNLKLLANSIALQAIDKALDHLSDDALRLLFAKVTLASAGEPDEALAALRGLERELGPMGAHEFAVLLDAVERANDRRFGPVPGY